MLQVHDEKIPLTEDDNGILHVAGTRVMLECVVEMHDAGAAPQEIVEEYDSLTLDQVFGVIFYYLRHPDEVKAYLDKRVKDSENRQAERDAIFPPKLREKLVRADRDQDAAGDD